MSFGVWILFLKPFVLCQKSLREFVVVVTVVDEVFAAVVDNVTVLLLKKLFKARGRGRPRMALLRHRERSKRMRRRARYQGGRGRKEKTRDSKKGRTSGINVLHSCIDVGHNLQCIVIVTAMTHQLLNSTQQIIRRHHALLLLQASVTMPRSTARHK